jgi:sensor c-di-GMP phosphodiesterase-like protein
MPPPGVSEDTDSVLRYIKRNFKKIENSRDVLCNNAHVINNVHIINDAHVINNVHIINDAHVINAHIINNTM